MLDRVTRQIEWRRGGLTKRKTAREGVSAIEKIERIGFLIFKSRRVSVLCIRRGQIQRLREEARAFGSPAQVEMNGIFKDVLIRLHLPIVRDDYGVGRYGISHVFVIF